LDILKVTDNLEYMGVDGRIILKLTRENGCEDVDWIHLAEDRE
jgi:hypothetical protein